MAARVELREISNEEGNPPAADRTPRLGLGGHLAPGADRAALRAGDEPGQFGPLNLQPQPGGKAWAPLKKPRRIRATYKRPHGNNVELAYTPHYGSWLNRIEAQFKALRYFTLDGTDHPDHATQARLIRRYIAWRNYNADDAKLRAVVDTANVA